MGILQRLFSGQQTAEQQRLLQTLLELEKTRITASAELENKRHEVELKKATLELEHLDAIGAEKRKAAAFNEELREKRRALAAKMREAKAAKRAAAQAVTNPAQPKAGAVPDFVPHCEECLALLQHRNPNHANHLISHAAQGHAAALEQLGLLAASV